MKTTSPRVSGRSAWIELPVADLEGNPIPGQRFRWGSGRHRVESDEGTCRQGRGPKDDVVPGDDQLELRFEGQRARWRYRLTRQARPDEEESLLDSMSYEDIIDQPRRWVGRPRDVRGVALSVDPNDAPAAGSEER